MQEYDPYQIKQEELLADIQPVNFHQCSDVASLLQLIIFLFFIEFTDKERFGSLQTFGVLQSVFIRMGQRTKNKTVFNHLLQLPWLLDGSVRNVFASSFQYSIQIRCIVFIVTAKIPECKGSISSSSFYGQYLNY